MKPLCSLNLFVLLLLVLQQASWASATDTVIELQQGIIAILEDERAADYQVRYQSFLSLVEATHDMQGVTRLALPRAWRALSNSQRSLLVSTMSQLSAATYASRFKRYNGQQFSVLNEQTARRSAKLVNAQFQTQDKQIISFDYLLRKIDDKWLISNIIVDGVSDLALKRAEYRKYLNAGGYDNLLKQLQKQIKKASDD